MSESSPVKGKRRRALSVADVRAIFWQIVVLGFIGTVLYALIRNTVSNLEHRHVTTGFAFLTRITGIPISGSVLDYDPAQSSYAMAFLIGLVNTLRVWLLVVLIATIAGTLIGLAKLSENWLLQSLASTYVEAIRNVPCLLQLLFWVTLIERLGPPDAARNPLPGVYLSNRGISFPLMEPLPGFGWVTFAFFVGSCAWLLWRRGRSHSMEGKKRNIQGAMVPILLLGIVPMALFVFLGKPLQINMPVRSDFDFTGGASMSGEFAALAIGLSVYGSAYIAEIVRAGVLAVPRGQWDAASAINLNRADTMRWVVLPQALRMILPPMTSQYLGLLKNSSLAIVLGYQDIVAVANLALSQTGQAIECIAIIMMVYLGISVPVSLLMNWYNHRIAIGGHV